MLRRGLPWFPAFVLLLWPLLLFKGPVTFPDTTPYLNGAATGVQVLLGIDTGLAEARMLPEASAVAGGGPAAAEAEAEAEAYTVSSARSPWFGGFLLAAVMLADRAGPALLQGVIVLAVIGLTCRNLLGHAAGAPYLAMVLALVTPLALYTDYMMPDLAAGVAILAVVNLMLFDARIGWAQRAFWSVLLLGTMLFHLSHVLIAAGVAGAAVALPRGGRLPWRGGAAVLLSGLVYGAAQSGFASVVERHYGAAPLRPPFLTARLVADGPGFDYLSENCAGAGFTICAYRDRMPAAELRAGRGAWYSNVLLWSDEPETGVFGVAGAEGRARISAEDTRFALAVLRHDPAGVIGATLSNTVRQFFRWRVDEIGDLYPAPFLDQPLIDPSPLLSALPTAVFDPSRLSPVYRVGTGVALAAALLILATAKRGRPGRDAVVLLVLVLIGLAVNAAVTGGLSGVDDRYQSRVIWLLPFAVLLAAGALWRPRGSG